MYERARERERAYVCIRVWCICECIFVRVRAYTCVFYRDREWSECISRFLRQPNVIDKTFVQLTYTVS